ncbi:MAG: matrixin family metalloprotease [Pseudomonadota bacterium]
MNAVRKTLIGAAIVALSAGTQAAQLTTPWTFTATNGGPFSPLIDGPPTLTWSFAAEGTTIAGAVGEPTSGSDLIDFLDTTFGSGGGGSDLTLRPWFSIFDDSFDRLASVSGLTFVYEDDDDGATISGANFGGILDTRGDIRIGGHSIDGQSGSNTLAYNYFPNHGDMVIDTDNTTFYSNPANDFRAARNVIMHELLHGVGLEHVESSDANFLSEPIINLGFDGPQFDDILGLHSLYGDVNEKNGGNDTSGTATSLGTLNDGDSANVGTDADDTVVARTDVDFVSIDQGSDVDFWSFTITEASTLDAILNPQGPTYSEGPQGGPQSPYDSTMNMDLILDIFDQDGTTILQTINGTGVGGTESGLGIALAGPGTYFARVRQDSANQQQPRAQLYELGLTVSAATQPPTPTPQASEPWTLALTAMGLFGAARTARRKKRA